MKHRILIGEDDPDVMKVTRFRLEHEGYEVVSATDGQQVLEKASQELPIHLILLDIKMPKYNGYDVCRKMKAAPETRDIPVIIFTASESQMKRLAERCLEVGARDWIKKPFHTKELMAKIHDVLGDQREEGGSDG